MTAVDDLHARLGLPLPVALREWDARVASWCERYEVQHGPAQLSEITLAFAVFLPEYDDSS